MINKYRAVIFLCILLCITTSFISCKKASTKTDIRISDDITSTGISPQPADMANDAGPTNEISAEDTSNDTNTEAVNSKTYMEAYKAAGELPSLAQVYKDRFRIGVALSRDDILNKDKAELVESQFNSITCENEMKADFTLDRAASVRVGDELCPVINMENADTALEFAKEQGLQMRYHTLVWHGQTPRWLFTVGYDDAPEAPFVSRDIMLARMENYIRQAMEYVNTNYPGIVYAWDVVNEGLEPGDGQVDGIRTKDNYWYQVVGDDFIEQAFIFARKYAAPGQKLFYNDYGTYDKPKLAAICNLLGKLKDKNLVDGIGMQDHMQLNYPAILDYQYAINKYAELGLEIQVTELDIDTPDESEEQQNKLAVRYKTIMAMLQKCDENGSANITSVTFWGLTDDRSWLNNDGVPSYPLLFNKNLEPKLAYFGALQDKSIKLY